MEKKLSMKRRLLNSRHLLWWLALPLALYTFYDNCFAHHHIKVTKPPAGTLAIPLQPDSSDLVPYIYKSCPFTILLNDSMEAVIDKSETFVYVLKDSCWLEHVLTGNKYIHGKDSTSKVFLEIRDIQQLRGKLIHH